MGGSDPWGCLITSTSLSHQFTEHRCAAQRRRPGEITCAISMGRCGYGPLRERVSWERACVDATSLADRLPPVSFYRKRSWCYTWKDSSNHRKGMRSVLAFLLASSASALQLSSPKALLHVEF